jgi:hypothetical protein
MVPVGYPLTRGLSATQAGNRVATLGQWAILGSNQ